jgi:dihydroorotate dehydrogenase
MGMMHPAFGWLNRPGLAGGIDKTGERADELLGLGFGSVEFGSVTSQSLPGSNPGLKALILAIATVSRKKRPKTAIGIGLGLPPDLPAEALADEWLQGLGLLAEAPPVVDYLSLNLSAAANRRFVGEDLRPVLLDALAQVAHWRHRQSSVDRPQLAVKLPLEAAIRLVPAIEQAGVGQMTVVISDAQARPVGLVMLRQLCAAAPGVRIVAVGGIRNATDRLKMLNAGCAGVQVHRLFVAEGAATPGLLLTC